MISKLSIMAKCSNCNTPDLTYDQTYFENTGQWRLWNPSKEQPHICPKKPEPPRMIFCPQCNALTRKKIPANTLQEHIKKHHLGFY